MKTIKQSGSPKFLILGGGMEITKITGRKASSFRGCYIPERYYTIDYVLITILTPRAQYDINYIVQYDYDEFILFLHNDMNSLDCTFDHIVE